MIWVAGWKLAVAVSRAGGLGLIGSGSMKPELLREHILKARSVWDGPLGVNIPLMSSYAEELAKVTINNGINIIFTSAGNPGKFTDYFHTHGAVVAHVVPSLKLALKSSERGVDAIVGEGTEAGGHNGYEEIPTFPLIPRLRDNIELPIIAAGGIRDGRGLAAALSLGADGVQIGTRFACTIESSASQAYKEAIVNSDDPATVLTLKRLTPTRMLRGKFSDEAVKAEAAGTGQDELNRMLGKGRAMKGIFRGNTDEGFMEAGEVAGDIDNIVPAETVVQEIVRGYLRTVSGLPGIL